MCQQPANIRAGPDCLKTEIAVTRELRQQFGNDPERLEWLEEATDSPHTKPDHQTQSGEGQHPARNGHSGYITGMSAPMLQADISSSSANTGETY